MIARFARRHLSLRAAVLVAYVQIHYRESPQGPVREQHWLYVADDVTGRWGLAQRDVH